MAAPMIPPAHARAFLAANGWGGADILPLAGDASFRRYFRVVDGTRTAVLMDAPPEHEDVAPFVAIAAHLVSLGLSAPVCHAEDRDGGLLLLEDFGDRLVGPLLAEGEAEAPIYRDAIDLLAALAREPLPEGLPPYDLAVMRREIDLFTEWYVPAVGIDVDLAGWRRAWDTVLATVADPDPRVLVLRDYHAENIILLDDRDGLRRLGLLDFQDALAGHPAYDLVSLLQDARRDVPAALEAAMLDRYGQQAGIADMVRFRAQYEILGAQRNTKILGIFTRLWKRDGKARYTGFQPRMWGYLERNLAHPALAPVARWFAANVPAPARSAAWA